MLNGFLNFGVGLSDVTARLAAAAVVVIVFLPMHEIAHLWSACKLNDSEFDFKSISLLDFFDPLGAVCLVLFGYGWAKTAYFPSQTQSKKEKILIALAGPLFNFISSILSGLALNVFALLGTIFFLNFSWILKFLSNILSFNVTLTVFNLIPVPPLDGFKVLEAMIPGQYLSKYYRNYLPISIILTVLLLFGFFSYPINILETAIYRTVLLVSGLPFGFIKSL